jgi:CRISPR-associated protein Csy1
MEKAIVDFFDERRAAWLKKNLSSNPDVGEVQAKEKECIDIFSLENWLPNAAKRAGQISISTHPCTFSHPSARKNKNGYASSIITKSLYANDGLLRSGNVNVEADALGSAGALDVYKFLNLMMADGLSLLKHIEQDTNLAKQLLSIKSQDYETLKAGFMAMLGNSEEQITSSKIKQVYFPVGDSYHQLSLLTASGIVFELRTRIDILRFSEESKAARICKKENTYHATGFKQLNNITTIGYGGTKPQNISVLNNKNGGKAHLLLSMPPVLESRDVQFPSTDFFSQSISPFKCKSIFYALHDLFTHHKNNWQVRYERDEYYRDIVDKVIQQMVLVRNIAKNQFNAERSLLNKTQRIWLCVDYEEYRLENDDWLDDLTIAIARFIFNGYEKVLKKKSFMFSDDEFKHIHSVVDKDKEALR